MIKVLYFAYLQEITNKAKEELEWADQSVGELITYIQNKYTTFPKETFLVAVNEEFVPSEYMIKNGDLVAFIPPVSGG